MENGYIQEYLSSHPIFGKIKFSSIGKKYESELPPVLQASQAIIDKYIETGERRVVIILPDDQANVIPMVVTKYFANLQERPEYSHGIWEDIKAGQHLKMGKAVVEFVKMDSDSNQLVLKIGKPTKTSSSITLTTPMKDYFVYFEKSNGALTSYESFVKEKNRIKSQLEETGMADVEIIKTRRTCLNKSFLILSQKNDFNEYVSDLFVSKCHFSDVVAYGDVDIDSKAGYSVSNLGKLDCLPAMMVASKLSDITVSLNNANLNGKIESIIVLQSKLKELTGNTDELIKCLRFDIPMIVFASESDFEEFPVLEEMGFEFWNWSDEMLQENHLANRKLVQPEESIFSSFSRKVFYSVNSSLNVQLCRDSQMKAGVSIMRKMLKSKPDMPASLNSEIFVLYNLGKTMMDLVVPIYGVINTDINQKLEDFCAEWNAQKRYYKNTEIYEYVEECLNFVKKELENTKTTKAVSLDELIKNSEDSIIAIVLPNRFRYKTAVETRVLQTWRNKKVYVYTAAEYIASCQEEDRLFDNVIVTFFDAADYIAIRKTYCYKKITYLLYDFENQWRRRHIDRINNCLPEDKIRENAVKFDVISHFRKKINEIEEDIDDAVTSFELNDYNFESILLRELVTKTGAPVSLSSSVECVPIIFDHALVGYFWPKHSLIDITDLCSGNADSPHSIEARREKRGNVVLFRKSEKDIVREKADELMSKSNALFLREKSEVWVNALRRLAEGKSTDEVARLINNGGNICDNLQIRYWIAGDTICPDDIDVLKALARLVPKILSPEKVDEVYMAGRMVQEYHRKAGRWITSELKQKSREIRKMYRNGIMEGYLEGIGEIVILTVDDVMEKRFVDRSKMNRIEEVL